MQLGAADRLDVETVAFLVRKLQRAEHTSVIRRQQKGRGSGKVPRLDGARERRHWSDEVVAVEREADKLRQLAELARNRADKLLFVSVESESRRRDDDAKTPRRT